MTIDVEESTVMDPENLPKMSYSQLCCNMGLNIVNKAAENVLGITELYEYLKLPLFIGPFGTIGNLVLVPAIRPERIVDCSGGAGYAEHVPLWLCCRVGFLYRCGDCDQIFMHVCVRYELTNEGEINSTDLDVKDASDFKLPEKGSDVLNSGCMINCVPVGVQWDPGGKLAIVTFAGKNATAEVDIIHPPDVIDKYDGVHKRFRGTVASKTVEGKNSSF